MAREPRHNRSHSTPRAPRCNCHGTGICETHYSTEPTHRIISPMLRLEMDIEPDEPAWKSNRCMTCSKPYAGYGLICAACKAIMLAESRAEEGMEA